MMLYVTAMVMIPVRVQRIHDKRETLAGEMEIISSDAPGLTAIDIEISSMNL
jgi:hypothetical protein